MAVGHFDEGVVKFNEGSDSGDHLHPSHHGYELMGRLAARVITEEEYK